MTDCKDLKKNQKLGCHNCGLEILIIKECNSKDPDKCCSKKTEEESHFNCCGKKMVLK